MKLFLLINTTKFKCTQSELYAACRTGWSLYEDHLTVFNTKKPLYDAAYLANALLEIDAAEALPGQASRKELRASRRLDLGHAADACITQWQLLKTYVTSAFSAEVHSLKLEAAGAGHYYAALRHDWEDVLALMHAGNQFITANSAALSSGNHMPAGFPAQFSAAFDDLKAAYAAYQEAANPVAVNTRKMQEANLAIYEKLMAMLKDARVYFKNDPVLKEQFTWTKLLSRVSSAGTAALSGEVRHATTQAPIPGVTLGLYTPNETTARYSATTTDDGSYSFDSIAGGTYTLKLEAQGQETKTETVKIRSGVHSRKNVTLGTARP